MATILEAVAADGAVQRLPMSAAGQTAVAAEPGYRYRLVDDAGGRVAASAQVKRIGGDLVVEGLEQDRSVVLEGFFTRCAPGNDCALSLENLGGTAADAIVPATAPIGALSGGGFLMYASGSAAPAIPAAPEAGFDFKPILGVAGGLAIVGGAGGGGGGGGGGSSDSTPPGAPVITSSAFTSTPQPVFTGTAEPGATVTITVAGAVTYATPVASDGNWRIDTGTATPTAGTLPAIAEGATVTVVARATDSAGNGSPLTSATVTLDSTAPDAPEITSALRTNDATPTIRGTAEAGARVEVALDLDGNNTVDVTYSTMADSAGAWVVEVGTTPPASGALPGGQLGDVSTTGVTVTAFDRAGNPSPTIGETLEVDVRIPGPPVIQPISVDNAINALEAGAAVTIRGTLPNEHPDRPVTVTWGTTSIAATVSGLAWEATFASAQIPADGTETVIASYTNVLGTPSVEGRRDVLIDRVAPSPPTITDDAPGSAPAAGPVTFVFTFTEPVRGFSATDVTVSGGTKGAFTGIDGDTVYTLVVTPTPGTEGNLSVSVPAGAYTDIAGNPNVAGTGPYVQPFDVKPPDVPTVNSLSTDNVTPTIVGTASAGDILTVTVNGVTYEGGPALIRTGNSWTLSIPSANALSEGTYNIVARLTDAAGNFSVDASTNELIIDSTPPPAPAINAVAGDDVVNGAEAAAGVTVSGTAEAGSNVTITWGATSRTATANSANTWTTTFTAGQLPADGASTISAVATDAVGNTGAAASRSVLIDTLAPSAPTVVAQVTNGTTPVITGTAAIGDTLTVEVGGVNYSVGANLERSGNDWTLTVPTPLSQGSYNVISRLTDAAGNVATDSTTNELIIDLTPPPAPAINAVAGNDVVNGAEAAAGVTVSGTAEAGSTVTVTWGSTSHTATANSANTWTTTFTAEQLPADGASTISAAATDAVGNTGAATQKNVTIDRVPPTVSIEKILEDGGGEVTSGGQTDDTTPTLVLRFDELFDIELFRDETPDESPLATISPTTSSPTTATFTDSLLPVVQTYEYTAQMTDTAGNVGRSDPFLLTIFIP